MTNKLKKILQYYSDMAASINHHSKNGAINTNAMKHDLKVMRKSLNDLHTVSNNELKNAQNIKSSLEKVSAEELKSSRELKKELEQIKSILRYEARDSIVKFSIVTASFNSGDYLPDYFFSLVKQKGINVSEDLEIIIVDDGSTDNTASIVEKWKQDSHLNIKYIYQENKGQSEARNLGLKYVTNEWVTFIDSDDFISKNYFNNISQKIMETNEELYVLPWEFYHEGPQNKATIHPLNWRFKNSQVVDITKHPEYINLSVSSAIFKNMYIKLFDLKFKDIKPNFEDAEFYLNYVTSSNIKEVNFINDAIYYYRKRADSSSTIDQSKRDPARFSSLLQDAYINALENYPSNITKMTILYDLRWNIEGFNNEIEYLSSKIDLNNRKLLLESIMKFYTVEDLYRALETKIISRNFYRVMAAHYFNVYDVKDIKIQYFYETKDFQVLKVETLESQANNINFISDNGNYKLTDFEYRHKDIYASELGNYTEYIVYIPKEIEVVNIDYTGHELEILKVNTQYVDKTFTEDSTILFFDRADTADDNAEHLYRWFKENKTEYKNIYFILKKDAKDWDRLEEEGFNMVDYDSDQFDKLYCEGDFIFSSGGDSASIENYKRYRYFWYKSGIKFIFLQHGITKDNIKNWLMSKRYDQMFTTLTKEYEFIRDEVFNEKMVQNVGMPRYDNLLSLPKEKKNITIFLTWRGYLPVDDPEKLKESAYYKTIISFSKIQQIINDDVLIILHPNMKGIFDQISKDLSGVEVQMIQNVEIQTILAESKVLITDYSSIAFDAAYINKPIIYYQFDKEEFFNNHTYEENAKLFSYEKDAFGDLVYTEAELIDSLTKIKANDYNVEQKYQIRKENQFESSPLSSSERIFNFMESEYKQ